MPTRTRLAVAFIAACLSATAAYALLRVGQWLVFSEPDPALVIYSAHAGYFWRSWIAAFFGAACGFSAWLAAARVVRHLGSAVLIATVLLIVQSIFVP